MCVSKLPNKIEPSLATAAEEYTQSSAENFHNTVPADVFVMLMLYNEFPALSSRLLLGSKR
jgi:hypothetical protein